MRGNAGKWGNSALVATQVPAERASPEEYSRSNLGAYQHGYMSSYVGGTGG